jgi:ribosome-binding factor A
MNSNVIARRQGGGNMVSQVRVERIAERIREELSELLLKDISDPRLLGVSVTEVRVDRELDYANIYVSAVEGSERAEEIMQGLIHARGFLRRELTLRINLRSFPRLRFHWDSTFERAEKMERLFALLQEEKKNQPSQSEIEMELEAEFDEELDDDDEWDDEADVNEELPGEDEAEADE